MRRFLAERIPSKGLKHLINIADVMDNISREIYRSKKNALQEGSDAIQRQAEGEDIMSVLRMCNTQHSVYATHYLPTCSEGKHGCIGGRSTTRA